MFKIPKKGQRKSIIGAYTTFVEKFASQRTPEFYQYLLDFEKMEEPASIIDYEYIDSYTTPVSLPDEFHMDYPLLNQDNYLNSDLSKLENIINVCDVYLWLGNHWPSAFCEEELCLMIRERSNELIC